MLSFSVMKSVPISLITFLQTISKIRFSKGLQNALGQVGREFGLSLTGRFSVVVGNGIFAVKGCRLFYSPIALILELKVLNINHSNSYIKRCG